ncbi:TPA: response regulator transcription factor [Clostridioides difficile]|nr:response regulator transcription factor [Clostridioides difficile]
MIKTYIEIYYDVQNLEISISNGNYFDLIYLGFKIEQYKYIDIVKKIRKIDSNFRIIYISNHESCLQELFEIESFTFINKPIKIDVFEAYFLKEYKKIIKDYNYFCFEFKKQIIKLKFEDIMYFESCKRIINVITINEKRYFYGKLNNIEKILRDHKMLFFRIHQSFLVNYKYIEKFSSSNIELIDGTIIKISKSRKKEIQLKYGKSLEKVINY